MRLAFTGTQFGMTPEQQNGVKSVLLAYLPKEAHHGLCIGSDKQFHEMVRALFTAEQCEIHGHPALNTKKQIQVDVDIMWDRKEYLVRNHDIVDAGDALLATPLTPETLRSGTWATIRYARKVGKPRVFVWRDGSITTEG